MTAVAKFTSVDQRQHTRAAMELSGTLFVPAEESTFKCSIVNLSAGGAGVVCDEPPPLNAFVVLYIEVFGRFDCVATRFVDGELGLRFVCKEAKRKRLVETLNAFIQAGAAHNARLRAHPRWRSNVDRDFTRADGMSIPCQVADFSLHGICLRTDVKPPMGEIVSVGYTQGRVVRHLDDGIAIQFVDISESTNNDY